jgi:hypothetical protein
VRENSAAPAVCQYANGDRYEGQFLNGQPHGQGIYTFKEEGRYQGEFALGEFNGQGVREFANGNRYEGSFKNGEFDGTGTFTSTNGIRYEGSFTNGSPSGRGAFTFSNGTRCEGDIKEGKVNGKGVCQYANKDRYEGELLNNLPHGQGIYTFAEGGRYRGNLGKGNFTVPPLVARSEVHRTHHPVEVEIAAGVRQSHLAAVRGQCQNRQIQQEGGVLRALPARLPPLALLAAVTSISDRSQRRTAARRVELMFDVDPNGKPFNIEILTSSKYDDLIAQRLKQ